MAKSSTPERKALANKFAEIADNLAGNKDTILPFATHLYSNKIISNVVCQNIEDSRNPPYERANQVLRAAESTLVVAKDPWEIFKNIYQSLKKVGLDICANSLMAAYQSNGGTVPNDLLSTPPSSPQTDVVPGKDASPQVEIEGELEMNELQNIVSKQLGDKWRVLGISLGFDDGELDAIEFDNSNHLECCRALFDSWKRRGSPPFTWSELKDHFRKNKLMGIMETIAKRRQYLQKFSDEFKDYKCLELDSSDISDLLDEFGATVQNKWKPIASELGLQQNDIDEIDRRRGSEVDRLMRVFNKWLRSLSAPNNWHTILVALCMPQVGEAALARGIAQKLKPKLK